MSAQPADFRARYLAAFERYLEQPEERDLQQAYELGREAVGRELSVLELAAIHHEALAQALADREDPGPVVPAAADFFLESLSSFEIVRRGFREAREAALVERRQAATLRRLSGFLGDTSLSIGSAESLDEALQLVAEHAREVVGVEGCVISVETDGARIVARSGEQTRARFAEPLTGLDGGELGRIELFDRTAALSDVDEALVVQLAQMTAAAVERAKLYGGIRAD